MEKSGVFFTKKKRREKIWLLGNQKKTHIFSHFEKKKTKMANLTRKKTRVHTNLSTLVKHFLYSKELREFP
jgi:hypothetical protein